TVGPPLRASALPMATTLSPTRSDDDAPSSTVWRPDAFLIFSSAMSLSLSTPTTSAWRPLVWPGSVTVIELAPAMTWALVSTSPSAVSTMPVPAPLAGKNGPAWNSSVLIVTTPGSTLASTPWMSVGLLMRPPALVSTTLVDVVLDARPATAPAAPPATSAISTAT